MKVMKRGKHKDAISEDEKARLSTMAEEEEEHDQPVTIKVGTPPAQTDSNRSLPSPVSL